MKLGFIFSFLVVFLTPLIRDNLYIPLLNPYSLSNTSDPGLHICTSVHLLISHPLNTFKADSKSAKN